MDGSRSMNKLEDEFSPYLSTMKDGPVRHYITGRLLKQIQWYDMKSRRNRRCYIGAMTFSITVSALIPVVTFTFVPGSPMDISKLIITVLGWSVTAVTSLSAFCRFRELWIQYRTQCELLKSTLHQFFLGGPEFKNTKHKQLAELCEGYMMKEIGIWATKVSDDSQCSSTRS